MDHAVDRTIENYARWLESVSATNTHRLTSLMGADAHYHTPLCEAQGRDAAREVFNQSYLNGYTARFKIMSRTWNEEARTVFLRWDCVRTASNGAKVALSGISEIMIAMDGKVAAVTDYWDRGAESDTGGILSRFFKR